MNTIIKMLLTLSIIGVISGAFLSQIAGWAAPKIEMHRKAATEEAIFLVQPTAKKYERVNTDFECYQVFDDSSNSLGFALPYEGNGFQGKIRLMVGVGYDLQTLTGMQVLEQLETPGLGTLVVEEPFTKQFIGLVASPQVNWIKGAPPATPNEIQTVTGATISSKAVVFIINDGLNRLRDYQKTGGAQ